MKALVIGATGAVGRDLVDLLLKDESFNEVAVFVRRPLGKGVVKDISAVSGDTQEVHPAKGKLVEYVVDFDRPGQWHGLLKGDVLFSCLGTTIKAAGSQEAQWKVDYTYQYEAAESAASNGVPTYVLVSSMGSNPKSKVFYTRMKGQLDEAVRRLPFRRCCILRPPSLVRKGSDRFGEKAGVAVLRCLNAIGLLGSLRPMLTEDVAAAMLRLAKGEDAGVSIVSRQDILTASLSLLLAVFTAVSCHAPEDFTLSPARGARDVNVDTCLALSFNDSPSVGNSGMIRVFDVRSGECVDSLDLSIPAGPTQSRTYAPDIDYTKVPYDYTRTSVPTNRNTVPGTPSGTAEPTPPEYQLNIIGGFTDAFHFHPVIVRGSTAVVYLHNNVLEYGRRYRVTIDPEALSVPDGSFNGLKDWTFTTARNEPSLSDTLVVDASGKGDFSTLQGALDFVPDYYGSPVVIKVMPGDYEEIVYVRNKSGITITGSGKDVTKVHYANNEVFNPHPMTVKTNERAGTFPQRRAAVAFDHCADLTLRDITFATDLKGQAEGLFLNGERIALYDVRIIGDGDALQSNGTVYMEDCELIGGGDTILGRGSLYAYHCTFKNEGGPFTWVRNFKPAHGDVFIECTFESTSPYPADYGRSVFNHGSTYTDAEMVVIDCRTRNFNPLGWSALGEPTVTMLEFNTRDMDTGEPVDVSGRHPFSRQLDLQDDAELLAAYRNPAFVLNGWKP